MTVSHDSAVRLCLRMPRDGLVWKEKGNCAPESENFTILIFCKILEIFVYYSWTSIFKLSRIASLFDHLPHFSW